MMATRATRRLARPLSRIIDSEKNEPYSGPPGLCQVRAGFDGDQEMESD
jgi:hypothetical protein